MKTNDLGGSLKDGGDKHLLYTKCTVKLIVDGWKPTTIFEKSYNLDVSNLVVPIRFNWNIAKKLEENFFY